MLKRPQWVKEKIGGREKTIPLQMTVKKKFSLQPDISMARMETMTTGSGVDGTVQPGKMVDVQVHEGEGIIPNNAMQGLTGREFQGLIETLSTGQIDKNKLREAIGMPTVTEYQDGGVVRGGRSRGVPDERAADTPATSTATPEYKPYTGSNPLLQLGSAIGGVRETMKNLNLPREGDTYAPAIKAPQQPAMVNLGKVGGVQQPETLTTPAVTTAPKVEAPAAAKAFDLGPIQQIQQPETVEALQVPAEKTTTAEPPPTEETVTTPVVSQAGEMVRTGLQNILAEAQGVSDVDRKIADFYLQNTDASDAANLRKLESQISADPNMSDQAKQAAIRGLQREAAARRSGITGELAVDAAKRASAASRDLVTYGGQVRSYEEVTLPAARQNLEIQRKTFDEITKPMSELQLKQLESQIGSQNWNEIQGMIDKGMSIERVNASLAEKGLPPLSTDEFANMLSAGSLGERNWNRQMSAASMLLTTPGENNKLAAAQMYSNLFGGVDFDFSTLITQENAEQFSNGLSQMASYVAAGWDADEAIDAMTKDGSLELMGIREEQARQFFNASKINALDAEWEEIETSQLYQSLLNSDNPADRELAADMKEFSLQSRTGMLDYDVLHEYKITGPDGVTKASVYAKTPEEAQTQADQYGVGYTTADTGNIEFAMKQPVEEGVRTGLTSKWDDFKKSIPSDVPVDQELYNRWETWQENNTGTYDDFIKTESPASKLLATEVPDSATLLSSKTSNELLKALSEDPEAVKGSDYYYSLPDVGYIWDNTAYNVSGTGVRSTRLNKTLKSELVAAKGKAVDLPKTIYDEAVKGQLVDVVENPTNAVLVIKKPDGKLENYIIYENWRQKDASGNYVWS